MANNDAIKAIAGGILMTGVIGTRILVREAETAEHILPKVIHTFEHETPKVIEKTTNLIDESSQIISKTTNEIDETPVIVEHSITSEEELLKLKPEGNTKHILFGEEQAIKEKNVDKRFMYRNDPLTQFKTLDEIDFSSNKNEILIVSGSVTEDEIKILNKKGVKFICNKEIYEEQKDACNFQVILVYSEDKAKLKELYSINDEQVNEVIKFSKPILNNSSIKIIDSIETLNALLGQLKSTGTRPVIIFNNKDNTLFKFPLSHYGITNAITCNSFKLQSDLFVSSTDFLGIKNVLESVANSSQANLFDFYTEFSKNYSTLLYKDKKYRATVVAATTSTAIGGTALIIYYNKS